MAGKEPGCDPKKMGESVFEMRKRVGFKGHLTIRGVPLFIE